jgi:curved DNA-binding protein
MDYQDYYQALGLKRNASQPEIKKAFRRLAREHHPDAKPGDSAAERRFKEINEAHAVLSDPEKRRKYDMLGANWEAYSQAGAAGSGGPFTGNPFAGFGRAGAGEGNVRYEFRTSGGGGRGAGEFSDFFRIFFGPDDAGAAGPHRGRASAGAGPTFEEILGQMSLNDASLRGAGGGGAPGPSGASRGGARTAPSRPAGHAEAIAEIGLEEAFHGTTRRLEVGGKRLEVTIPRGADNGTRIKLTGQGPGGADVVVVVRVRPHPVFSRRGADLERELPITLAEALLGSEVPVRTLKGKVLLRIPAGTQNGRTFRLKGQGMPHLRIDDVGDLLAKVRVVLPSSLDPEAEEAARQFLDRVDQPDPR